MWVYHDDINHTSLPLVQYLFYDNHHEPNGYKTKINLSPIMLLQSQSNHVTLASAQSCCFSLNPKSITC